MTQNEAMHMSNEQAVQILKPMRDMMRDQHGCPISDAYFAIEKAIRVLTTISLDEVRGVGEWEIDEQEVGGIFGGRQIVKIPCCSNCGTHNEWKTNYCPNCGARMKGADA